MRVRALTARCAGLQYADEENRYLDIIHALAVVSTVHVCVCVCVFVCVCVWARTSVFESESVGG